LVFVKNGGDNVSCDLSQDTNVYKRPLVLDEDESKKLLGYVYEQLKIKGYSPTMQIVGYLITGDPTYITAYGDARKMVTRLDRYDVLGWIVKHYVDTQLGA
jgi:uncharacterized protein (UPF0297 family)